MKLTSKSAKTISELLNEETVKKVKAIYAFEIKGNYLYPWIFHYFLKQHFFKGVMMRKHGTWTLRLDQDRLAMKNHK